MKNLENLNVKELNLKELREVDGGFLQLAAVLLGVAIGYVIYHLKH